MKNSPEIYFAFVAALITAMLYVPYAWVDNFDSGHVKLMWILAAKRSYLENPNLFIWPLTLFLSLLEIVGISISLGAVLLLFKGHRNKVQTDKNI